jgi:type IX secretion system PorP/SprF family membrane protein
MKKRLLAFSAFIALTSGVSLAQQDKLITHFIFDKMSINPGSTGINDGICGTMIYRNQWDKVNGAPNSALFNAEANLDRYYIGGVGLSFYHDAIGYTRQNNLQLNYSYHLFLQNTGTLGIGVGVGMMNVGMDPKWIPPTTAFDGLLPLSTAGTNLDVNAGLYFRGIGQKFYVGVSATHLAEAEIATLNYSSSRHYYLMTGYRFRDIFGAGQDLDAQVLGRSDLVEYSADVNVRYIWNDKIYGGITYRTSDAVAGMLGVNFGPWTFGYSYDLTLNKLSNISRGTHELMAKYCYYLPPVPVHKYKHPRWL